MVSCHSDARQFCAISSLWCTASTGGLLCVAGSGLLCVAGSGLLCAAGGGLLCAAGGGLLCAVDRLLYVVTGIIVCNSKLAIVGFH